MYRRGGGGCSGCLRILSVVLVLSEVLCYEYQESYLEELTLHGLFPNVFNLAASSVITVNATCGETGPEVYCKLVEHVYLRENEASLRNRESQDQCGVCDAKSTSQDKKHPIENAIDGTNRWWQSPTLQNGKHYEWVTITLDLKQVYQIAYVIVKAAISPRPGNWILERSLDGIIYQPWQYYSLSDKECWDVYGIKPTVGKPHYRADDEVICTSYYSKLNPLENGEIHTSLVNGRPGVDGPSSKLMEFTKARYVRLRLQKIKTLHADLMTMQIKNPENTDKAVSRRYFYSIKDISVGGQCACSGHAATCVSDPVTGKLQCQCEHNTCGDNCDKCCPLYNQKPWNQGTSNSAAVCEQCQCYGHSDQCHYEQIVADKRLSINVHGLYKGGGVCDKCKHHTTGINCEQCEDGYYRPSNVLRNHTRPCRKCQCTGVGMTGFCVKDDSHLMEGLEPGDCFCKTGFSGKNCDECDIGYKNYPSCEPCPCYTAGTVGSSICEGECICKTHVEGSRCDKCKQGYYHLSPDNPDGCSQCFCFGITDECTESDWGVNIVQNIEDWRVTDLRGTRIVKPTPENGNVVIANDDVTSFSTYYWLAPPDYLGKKLYSYGSDLKFTLSYVVARGDTSGTYTENADVVLEGNGQQIGYNWGIRPEEDEVAISIPLREQGWFLLSPREDGTNSVTREDFTLILNDLTKLLIRAKFHTDQIEGRLHNIGMEVASNDSNSLRKIGSVEKCFCPLGYTGLSCELCAPGYKSITGPKVGHICERCDCYNHAESCDGPDGRCENCMHHTTGLKCDRCIRGYYGDAKIGTPDDCKPCACPLENPENNFSPSCTAITAPSGDSDYICDRCAEGYEGNKCERCSDGYFGNPQVPGGYCQKCDCSGNADTSVKGWCDSLTGQCLKCLGNTAGWNCDECMPEHFGDASRRYCEPCSCNPEGSLSSQCDLVTGQCICKPGVIGRTCNRCADGYGNLEAGCEPCNCNRIGSHSEVCDPSSGHCSCKPGVFGTTCDSCLEGYYGFSSRGCQECRCDRLGSVNLQCNENNGQCSCKPHVIERACDRCQDGYWNLQSGNGCEECHCNRTGSLASVCDKNTGQCNCKPGIGGKFCDQCSPGYFMFSPQGCRACEPCNKPGHICDPRNGRCVCPPYTTGQRCQKCVRHAWGYDPLHGCKPCDCNRQGSPQQSCDPNTGNCICLEGFEGRHCDQCRQGFFNFPKCNKCDCNFDGTVETHCRDTVCQCNNAGDCPCKQLVTGRKCDKCVDGAFGLSADNKKGCYECFCFGKTRICNQANMYWTKASFPSREIFVEVGTTEIPTLLGFQVFPEEVTAKRIGIPYVLDKPMYWSLPKDHLGDKVLTYNGYLNFHIESRASSKFPDKFLESYPLVMMQGNHRITLYHSGEIHSSNAFYSIKLHEDEWKTFDNPLLPVTKSALMVALQNLQYILIRGVDGPDVKYARLLNVSMDVASPTYALAPAKGVEMCRCPRQYTGTSCQDPAPGYYRKRKPNYLNSKDVLDLVGWAEPCECNNHTNVCDKETGVCINCGGNTMGEHCDQCIKGYYGDPSRGPCRPCACPHLTNSFSDTCVPDALDYTCINCQAGYTGRHCEKCDLGYYGDLTVETGKCQPCNCNPYGSRRRECDSRTGQCQCNEGVSGRDCTVCNPGYILTEYGCKSCEDECTGILLRELYDMKLRLDSTNLTDLPRLPWGYLDKISNEEKRLKPLVDDYQRNVTKGKDLVDKFTFYLELEAKADMLLVRAKGYVGKAKDTSVDAKDTFDEAKKLLEELNKMRQHIKDLVAELEAQGKDPTGPGVSVERMLREAERMLQEIKSRQFGPDKENADRELRKAQNLLNNIKKLTLDRARVDDLKDRLKRLDEVLSDMIKNIDESVRKPMERTLETLKVGRGREREVNAIVGEIYDFVDSANKTLKEADELLGLANGAIIDAAVKFEFLPRLLRDLDNATNQLDEHQSILARLNPLYKEKYVIPAQKHADELERQSELLANLFRATKDLSKLPLEAAKAYQRIVDAILAADLAAREAEIAAENAYRQAYPDIGDALTEQADKARAKSLQLLLEAQKLNDEKVPELEEKMRERKNDLDNLAEDLAFGKRSNDIINRELDTLPKGVKPILDGAVRAAKTAEDQANNANRRADELLQRLDNDLTPKFESIRAGSVSGLDNLTRIIQKAREDTKEASRLADSADSKAKRVRKQHELTKLNLKELKDKILLARQKASSIRIGLTSDTSGTCMRSYSPTIEPSTTNNIVLNYATKSNAEDSLLFFIGSSKEEDFMAIEMVNRKIRFLWNVGGGTKVIVHDKEIETNNEQLLKNSQWFKIEANRIGNIGTLSVKRTPDGQKPDPLEVTGSSPAGYTKMDLDSSSNFFVGGFPDNFLPPSEIITSKFSGCLYEVLLDGKPVGLWNFMTNLGCDGCKEGATEDIDISAYEFQGGNSYAIVPQTPFYKKSALFADLSFKTLNEDALLFLVCNNEKGHMISLELTGGKIVYQIMFGNRNHIRIESKKKYNTGEWVSVEAAREDFEAQVTVQDEILDDTFRGGSSDLDLKHSSLYFGGVPPNFTKESWPGVTFTNFFGCMKDLQLDATPVDLSKGSFYGMNVGCSNRPMKIATFNGGSYLELNGHALPMDSGISFSFMTSQADGLLVLSTFKGQNRASTKELQNYYSIALKDGRIVAIFNSGDGEVLITSERTLSRNALHTVNIIRKNRRLALRLDDEADSDIRLPKGAKEILSPKEGGLFFGGVKRGIDVGSMAASQQPFIGVIQDAIFNDKLLRFESAINHKGVDFGLPPDQQSVMEEFFLQMAPSLPNEHCAPDLRAEENAVSHQSRRPIHIPQNKKDIILSFNMSLEYRTFYPDGNIISLSNEPKKLHLSMFLEKGMIKMHYSYRKENKTENSNKELMIGKWHKIDLLKKGKHLTVFLDDHHSVLLPVPKKLPFKSLNIGGIPLTSSTHNELLRSFKGCFRNLEINGKDKKIPSDISCFKHVDFGTFFTGKSYVEQDHGFHLGNEIELNFEFRTVQYIGTLFSIFSRFSNTWFEISLSDNSIIATLYETSPQTKAKLVKKLKYVESCDYKWHSIQMLFRDNHFTLNVDDFRPVEEKIKEKAKELKFAEIYIGGKPDKHPYKEEGEANFSGCLRGITLNGEVLQIKNPETDANVVQYMCPQI
ncbi:laminin subunit alpha-1 isoform X2 [Parasteatoda tepidariorum]|uniref:laminin subunit alpha-1 isoform X2 n=1 Tax=Parasteatoda tepidariorum TaxID=114398 RepID=UPI00077F8F1C|nr:laminin subunit alpha-1 isoform X2 [Parasteatoda tepidariorum]